MTRHLAFLLLVAVVCIGVLLYDRPPCQPVATYGLTLDMKTLTLRPTMQVMIYRP